MKKAGYVETFIKVMNTHFDNASISFHGCGMFTDISEANSSIQKYACEKGCIDAILKTFGTMINDEGLSSIYCASFGYILSSRETHSKYFTEDVLNTVKGCLEKYKDSKVIHQFYKGLMREEDPRVCDAVQRGVCTKEAFPKCSPDCKCDKNNYCEECCIQQKAFRCFTCDKDDIRLYCETCWKKNHQGHECEEFFYPVRCATNNETN